METLLVWIAIAIGALVGYFGSFAMPIWASLLLGAFCGKTIAEYRKIVSLLRGQLQINVGWWKLYLRCCGQVMGLLTSLSVPLFGGIIAAFWLFDSVNTAKTKILEILAAGPMIVIVMTMINAAVLFTRDEYFLYNHYLGSSHEARFWRNPFRAWLWEVPKRLGFAVYTICLIIWQQSQKRENWIELGQALLKFHTHTGLICATYAVLGALINLYFGSWLPGTLIGASFGVLVNRLSKKVLRVQPAM